MADSKTKGQALGRGLDALFGDEEEGTLPPPSFEAEESNATIPSGIQRRMLGTDQLVPSTAQPRRHMDEDALKELAESIAVHGVIQPILVREKEGPDGLIYEIIAGERRWLAAQRAQLHEVPVTIREMDDVEALEIALIENLQREDLNPLEEAQGYRRLMDECGHTQEKLAASLGKSRSHVANMMRLLSLPEIVQAFLRDGDITTGHARALITAEHPEGLAKKIVAQGLSVRETERLAGEKAGAAKEKKPKPQAPEKDADTKALEEEMSAHLGMRFTLDMKAADRGTVKIDFSSLDQLDALLKRLSQ